MTRKNATFPEKMRIYEFLGSTALQFGDDGKAIGYNLGFDDEIVAKAIAPHISLHTVAKVRVEVYGCKLREPTHGLHGSSLTARVAALEEQVAKLTTSLTLPLIPRREVA